MASSILNSDDGVISGTSGLKSSGGDDGVLVFQSKGTETARINTDKQIVAAAGTASLPIYSTTGDLNTGIYFPAADNIGFATNGVIRGRWTNDGLCFNADTAAANALDDYEEGTWTPTSPGATFSSAAGQYVKVGQIVTISFRLVFNSVASGAAATVTLPFTAISAAVAGAHYFSGCATYQTMGKTVIVFGVLENSTNLQFFNGQDANVSYTECSTDQINGSITYRTAT